MQRSMLNKIKEVGHLQPRRGACKTQQGYTCIYRLKKNSLRILICPFFFIVADFV